MKLSQLFTKTKKQAPAGEVSKNAQLLIRAGFINKEMAGVYNYMPLGLKVIENIKKVVREEMNQIGGQEFLMSTLQRQEIWEKTDRWDEQKVDVWFKSQLKNGTEVGFGWSHEEPIVDLMRDNIHSYKDMPFSVYQFQNKLRNEERAKSGVMRGREFIMKDLYSFSVSEEEHQKFYQQCADSYMKVFERLGLADITYYTYADGGSFYDGFSHEFQTLCDNGEDTIYVDLNKKIALNEEVLTDEVLKKLDVSRENLVEKKAAEVGNIFSFGSSKAEQIGLYFKDEDDQQKPVILGSYGIGISRLMGVLTEIFADEKGLVWPKEVAPARVHIVQIGDDQAVVDQANQLYEKVQQQGFDAILDDRDERAGAKLADADLIGVPVRVVVSSKTVEQGKFEVKERGADEASLLSESELFELL